MPWNLKYLKALTAANVPADKARAVATSIKREINEHYALHAEQLATRGDVEQVRKEVALVQKDVADLKSELMKTIVESQRWTITAIFAAVALFAAITNIWH